MSNDTKCLVIGLDGGTWRVLKPLIEEGEMPTLAWLVEQGTCGVLNSTIPPITASAWVSLQTGVSPNKHGIYDFVQYQSGSYKPNFVNSQSIRQKTIWNILNEAGKKVALIGVPITYPPEQVNGVIVSGLLTPSLESNFTYPPELRDELMNNIRDYRFITTQDTFFRRGLNTFLKKLIYTEKKRMEAAEFVFNKYQWDVGVVQFQSLDNLQHALWPILAHDSQEYSPERRRKVINFFQFLDRAIEKLLTIAGENTDVIVISDHGFGRLKKIIFLNRWLEHNKFLVCRSSFVNKSIFGFLNLTKRIDFLKLHYLLLKSKREAQPVTSIINFGIDWHKTKAYMLSGSQAANIYINIQGREPEGIVVESEYTNVREELKEKLLNLIDPETGESVIKKIYYREEISSANLQVAPDLLVIPVDGYMFSQRIGGSSDTIFQNRHYGRDEVGCHCQEGIYSLYGPSFSAQDKGPVANIVDVPATILALMKVKIPSYFDGRPMEFGLKESVSQQRMKEGGEIEAKELGKEVYLKEEKQLIEKRLKNLGYL